MIRLIASDLDGTLLPTQASTVSDRLFTQIRELHSKGILFCAASGRQYQSLRRLFAPVIDDIAFVCENGSIVYYQDKIIGKTLIDYQDALQLVAQINAEPDCEALVSGATACYIFEGKGDALAKALQVNNNRYHVIKDPSELPDEIIKISIYCTKGAAPYAPIFAPVWEKHLNVAIAGKQWLDFTLAHKGIGLAQLTDALGIAPRDCMVFGDNFNDVGMFHFAGVSYVMENADPKVQAFAQHRCDCVEDVLQATFGLSV